MSNFLGGFLTWLTGTKSWTAFAKHWLGGFTCRVFDYPKFPMTEYFKIQEVFAQDPSAMYAFVCADTASLEWKGINLVSGSQYGHCGIVVQGDNGLWVYHMKSAGRSYWHLLDILREVDNFALVKLPLTAATLPIAQGRFQSFLAAPSIAYNYQIDMSAATIAMLAQGTVYTPDQVPAKLYCSEVLYMIGGGIIPAYTQVNTLGELRFEPDQVYQAGEVVYTYNSVTV